MLNALTAGLFVFALTFRSFTDLYWLGLLILVVTLVLDRRTKAPVLPHSIRNLSVIYAAIVSVLLFWTLSNNEYSAAETLLGFSHYFEFLLFIPVSVAMYRCKQRLLLLCWVPVLAVSLRILGHIDLEALDATIFSTAPYGFGQHHVTFGMQAMLALLIIAALTPATLKSLATRQLPTRALVILLLMAATALCLQALMVSGSRSAWGCLLVGLVTLAFCHSGNVLRSLAKNSVRLPLLALCALLLTLAYHNADIIKERLVSDTNTDFKLSLSIDELPRDYDVFFARRVHLAYFGLQNWQQRPLLGYGPVAVQPLLAKDPDFHIHPHLHNTYVQLLVEVGLVGTLAFIALFLLVAACLWRYRPADSHGMQRDIYALIIASTASLGIWSGASFHLHSTDWRFAVIWYAALAAAIVRESKYQADNPAPNS